MAQDLRYPIYNKEQFGPFLWPTIHNVLATMPKNPTDDQKKEYSSFLEFMFKNLPCKEDCAEHAMDYFKKNPFDLSDPKKAFLQTCAMHNDVNKRNNKQLKNCEELWDDEARKQHDEGNCPTCSIKKHVPQPEIKQDVGNSLENYKNISIQLFQDLCKNDNLPVPEIKFEPCPENKETSCNLTRKDGEQPEIYMHPAMTSLRSIYHEYDHYKKLINGQGDAINEDEANKTAFEKIGEKFKLDNESIPNVMTTKDEHVKAYEDGPMLVPPTQYYTPQPSNPMANVDNLFAGNTNMLPMDPNRWQAQYPVFNQTMNMLNESEVERADRAKYKEGVLQHFDSFFEKPAEWAGIEAEEMSLFHTPLFLRNAVTTLIETNTTPLGSALINLVLGGSAFAVSVTQKHNLRYRDNLVLQLLAASFLWNSISYLNPKTFPEMKEQIANMAKLIKSGKIKDALGLMVETPKMYQRKKRYENMYPSSGLMIDTPHTALARSMNTNIPPTVQVPQGPGIPLSNNNMTREEEILSQQDASGSTINPSFVSNQFQNTRGADYFPRGFYSNVNPMGMEEDPNANSYSGFDGTYYEGEM